MSTSIPNPEHVEAARMATLAQILAELREMHADTVRLIENLDKRVTRIEEAKR